jgi:MFS family permease
MNVPGRRSLASAPFFYGWVVVGAAAASNISRVASAVEVSTLFLPVFTAEFGWSVTAIASATTIGSIGGAATGPLVGWLVDRFGPRVVVSVGAAIVGGACFALAGVNSLGAYIVLYAIVRYAGQGLVLFTGPVAVANWFDRKRGTALAALFAASALGLIVAPVGVQWAIDAGGWRAAWVALGGLAVGLGVLPALVLLVRRPEDVGLQVDGEPANPMAAGSLDSQAPDWSVGQAMATPALWLIMGSTFLVSVVTTGVGFHQLPFYLERGLDSTIGAAVVSTFAIGLAAGSAGLGWLADRVSPKLLTVGENVVLAVLMGLLLSVHSPAQAFGFAFVFGLLVGGYMTLPTVLVAGFYGRRSLGAISGVVNVVRGFGLALGPMVAGVFFDVVGGYEPAFVTFGVMAVGGALLMALVQSPAERAPASVE